MSTAPTNLPAHLPPLIGRGQELAAVRERLLSDEVGLVTLTGTGGVGKTRLAVAVAAHVLEHFPDGVLAVTLAALRDRGLVLPTIARALGLQEAASRPALDQLKSHLESKRLLLVLDNFEHLLDAAPQVAELLRACSGLKVLATSRAPLHVYGEHEFRLAPLALPVSAQAQRVADLRWVPAVALFVERARAATADFALTEHNAPAVADICRRLDGLPLAIELAAARTKVLTPQALLGRLIHRLAELTGGPRDVPARHQTLRDTLAWSYELLTGEQRRLFRRMAVFSGGCSLAAIADICEVSGDPLHAVAALVDSSLVLRGGGADEPRFSMLETIREYGLEQLEAAGEAESVRRRHLQHYMAMAGEADTQLRTAGQETWLPRLDAELDNFRAALSWCRETGQTEPGLQLAVALDRFWNVRGSWAEGRRWLDTFLAAPSAERPTRLYASGLRAAGWLARTQGDYATARRQLDEAVRLFRRLDDPGLAYAILLLGLVYWDQEEYDGIPSLYEDAIRLSQEAGDMWTHGVLLNVSGLVSAARGDYERAEQLCGRNLAIVRELGDQHGIAEALNTLGDTARCQGRHERARELYEESLALCREHRLNGTLASVLHNLGYVAISRADAAGGAPLFAESLNLFQELGDTRGVAECLAGAAAVALALGQHNIAAQLLGGAQAMLKSTGARLSPSNAGEHQHTATQLRAALGAAQFQSELAAGESMSSADAIARALALASELTASPDATPAPASDLSAREREVAELVAQGLTNREIAARLVVSERTVATHVEHILNKLSFRSRAQIATWVAEQRLLSPAS